MSRDNSNLVRDGPLFFFWQGWVWAFYQWGLKPFSHPKILHNFFCVWAKACAIFFDVIHRSWLVERTCSNAFSHIWLPSHDLFWAPFALQIFFWNWIGRFMKGMWKWSLGAKTGSWLPELIPVSVAARSISTYPGRNATPSQVTSSQFVSFSQQLAGTHLIHLGGERHCESKVSCTRTQHNTMSAARAQTRTARSGVERTNHKATAPPQQQKGMVRP